MSSVDIPPSMMKKRSSGNYSIENQGLVDLTGVIRPSNAYSNISSILQKKSNVARAVDMTRHTIEPATETTAMSIVKRSKVPAAQSVAIVSAQKVVGTGIFYPSSNARQNKSVGKQQKRSLFDEDIKVQDADYREMTDEILSEMESSPKYNISKSSRKSSEPIRKASREFTKGTPVEPASMQAISAQKRKTISNLAKSSQKHWGDDTLKSIDNTVDVAGGIVGYVGNSIQKGMKKQAKEIANDINFELETNRQARATKDEFYRKQHEIAQVTRRFNKIEQAKKDGIYYANTTVGERTLDRAKKVQKIGNKIIKTATPVVVDAFKAIDAGATAFGNSTIGKNLNRNAEAEYNQLRLTGRRAMGSIVSCGHKGSLVTQHSFGTNNNTYNNTPVNAGSASTSYGGVYCRYERGIANRPEIHFYSANSGRRLTHTAVAQVLPKQIINKLKKEAKSRIFGQVNNTSTTTSQPIQSIQKPAFTNGTTRVLNKPKTTTRSGLVHRTNSKVV